MKKYKYIYFNRFIKNDKNKYYFIINIFLVVVLSFFRDYINYFFLNHYLKKKSIYICILIYVYMHEL